MHSAVDWTQAVVTVGGGRGFVVGTDRQRFVITAGHCLPGMPPCCSFSHTEERTFARLLGPITGEPTVWAECLFVDPVSDLAVLGSPDGQALYEEAEAYEALVDAVVPLPIGRPSYARLPITIPEPYPTEEPMTILGPTQAESGAWLLSLDGRWFGCKVESLGRGLWIRDAGEAIRDGMSGSPIISPEGAAIGVLCCSSGETSEHHGSLANPELWQNLPGWLWREITGAE
jgi:hypothetical protein